MADGLDSLLDEVEAKFCREISPSHGAPTRTGKAGQDSHGQQRSNASVNSISDPHEVGLIDKNIEAVLQEILEDDYPASSSHTPVLSKTCTVESCSQTALRMCCPVYLGGSSIASGVGTSVSQRVCDRLRCTSCDFRVIMFGDQEWDSSCDYLFFRNNMPDSNKLRVKLKRRRGARAYACQCSWYSAITLSELRHTPKLKWVCGKHTAC